MLKLTQNGRIWTPSAILTQERVLVGTGNVSMRQERKWTFWALWVDPHEKWGSMQSVFLVMFGPVACSNRRDNAIFELPASFYANLVHGRGRTRPLQWRTLLLGNFVTQVLHRSIRARSRHVACSNRRDNAIFELPASFYANPVYGRHSFCTT